MQNEEVFDFLNRLAKSIAIMFGENCETLIHDMSVPNHPILSIYNSNVSGRTVGSTVDIYGDESGEGFFNESIIKRDFINMQVVTQSGKKVKSTTIHCNGDGYSYALGINYDYTKLQNMSQLLHDFIKVNRDLYTEIKDTENIQLEDIVNECISIIGKDPKDMCKKERLQIMSMLKERNVFHFQKAVPYVSEKLKVSRYTIYKYMNEI